jgi:hypothetical protein
MSDLMEWLLILALAYNLFAVWTITNILDKILRILVDTNQGIERMNRNR